MNENDLILYKQFQKSPILFIEKMWGLFPQKKGEPFQKGKNITWQQTEILKAIEKAISGEGKNRISIKSGHGIGKSSTLAMVILWYLFCYQDCQIGVTAPTADQMYDVLWKEISLWLNKMPEEIKHLYDYSNTYIRIKEKPDSWFARAKTARKENPEALAGLHSDYVMIIADEASGVPDEIYNTMEGALTGDNFLVILISNPTRLMGYFYDTHHKDKNNWQNLSFNCEESPIVDNGYVERIIEKHGIESDEYRIRVKGEFPREDSIDDKGYVSLLSEKDINIITIDDFVGQKILGIDPAGEGDDETVWVLRDNFKAKVVGVEKISNEKTIAQKTLTIMDMYNISPDFIVVDNFGVGANVGIELAMVGKRVKGLNVGIKSDDPKFLNKRAELYRKLREWLKKGGELYQNDRWSELLTIKYRRELSDKIKIMGKEEMRKLGIMSPNSADALMLTFFLGTDIKVNEINKKPFNLRQKFFDPVKQSWNSGGKVYDDD